MRIIQLSDIHLFADRHDMLGGINTQASLEAILQDLQKNTKYDLLLLTGDLSQDGSAASYQRLAKTLAIMNCPVYWIPGNHDDLDVIQTSLSGDHIKNQRSLLWDNWQIILLDSMAPGLEDGFLADVDFDHLQSCLDRHPQHHTIIALHHHPLAVGCYMDEIMLINAQAFLDKLSSYPQIRAVIFGHVHQVYEQQIRDISFLSAPATCVQFLPNHEEFALDTLMPGYRWIEFTKDGNFSSGVQRLPESLLTTIKTS